MPYAWRVLIGAFLGQMASLGFGRFTYAAILPSMRDGMQLTYSESGFVATANLIGYVAGSLVIGVAATRWGARRAIAGATALTAAGLLATAAATSLPVALAAQVLTGAATTGGAVLSVGLMTPWFTRARRGIASGIVVGGVGAGFLLGSAVAPALGVWLAGTISGAAEWRYAWVTLAALVILSGASSVGLMRNRPEEVGQRPWGPPDPERPPASSTAGASAPTRSGRDGPVWRDPVLVYLGAIYASFGFGYTSFATFFPATLVAADWSQVDAAHLWALVGAVAIPGGIAWGRLSDRFGRTAALAIGFLVMAAAAFLLAGLSTRLAVVTAVLFGVSLFATPTLMAAAAGDRVGPVRVYAAFGFLSLWSGAGQVLGPTVSGVAIDLTRTLLTPYWLSGGMAATGALLSGGLALAQARRSQRPPHRATAGSRGRHG